MSRQSLAPQIKAVALYPESHDVEVRSKELEILWKAHRSHCTPEELVAFGRALNEIERWPDELLNELGNVAQQTELSPNQVVVVGRGLARCRLSDPDFYQFLIERCRNDLSSLSPEGLANVLWSLAKTKTRDLDFVAEVGAEISRRVEEFDGGLLVRVLWSYTALGIKKEGHFENFGPSLCERVGQLSARDTSKLWLILPRLEFLWSATLVKNLLNRTRIVMGEFDPRGIDSLFSTFGKMELNPSSGFVTALFERATTVLSESSARDTSSLLLNLSTADLSTPTEFIDALLEHAKKISPNFNSKDTKSFVLALAKLQIAPEKFEMAVSNLNQSHLSKALAGMTRVSSLLSPDFSEILIAHLSSTVFEEAELTDSGVSHLLRTLAKLKMVPSGKQSEALLSRIFSIVPEMTGANVSYLLRGMAALKLRISAEQSEALLTRICTIATDDSGFHSNSMSHTLSAMANLKLFPSKNQSEVLLARICTIATDDSGFRGNNISHLISTMANLKLAPTIKQSELLLTQICSIATDDSGFDANNMSHTLSAMANLGLFPSENQSEALLSRICSIATHDSGFTAERLSHMLSGMVKLRLLPSPEQSDVLLAHISSIKVADSGFTAERISHAIFSISNLRMFPTEAQSGALLDRICSIAADGCKFTAENFSHTLPAIANLKMTPSSKQSQTLIAQVCKLATDDSGFTAEYISHALFAMANLRLFPSDEQSATLIRRVCSIANHDSVFTAEGISHTLFAIANLNMLLSPEQSETLLTQICVIATDDVGFTAKDISRTLSSMVNLRLFPSGEQSETLLSRICSIATDDSGFAAEGLSHTISGMASLKLVPSLEQSEVLLGRISSMVSDFNADNVSYMLPAMSKLEILPSSQLCSELVSQAMYFGPEVKARTISSILLALVTFELTPPPEVVGRICSRTTVVVSDLNPQDVAAVLTAVTKLELNFPDQLMRKLFNHGIDISSRFNPQDVSLCLYALSCIEVPYRSMIVNTLATHAIDISGGFQDKHVPYYIRALNRLRSTLEPGLLDRSFEALALSINQTSPNSRYLAGIIKAGVSLGQSAIPFLKEVSGQVRRSLPSTTPNDLALVAWSYGKLRIKDDQLADAIWWRLEDRLSGCDSHALGQAFTAYVSWYGPNSQHVAAESLLLEFEKRPYLDLNALAVFASGNVRMGTTREALFQKGVQDESLAAYSGTPYQYRALSKMFHVCLQTTDASDLKARESFRLFHESWLLECIETEEYGLIPEALAGLQGRKISAWIADRESSDLSTIDQELSEVSIRLMSLGEDPALLEGSAKWAELTNRRSKLIELHEALVGEQTLSRLSEVRASIDVDTKTIQHRLCPDEAVVLAYPLLGTRDGAECRALVIRKESAPIDVPLPGLSQLVSGIKAYSPASQTIPMRDGGAVVRTPPPPQEDLRTLEQIYTAVRSTFWSPIKEALGDARSVTLIPQADLQLLPFEIANDLPRMRLFPNLMLYFRHQIFGATQSDSSEASDKVPLQFVYQVYDAHHHTDFNYIPLVNAESRLLDRLGGVSVDLSRRVPHCATCLHVASHGTLEEPASLVLGPSTDFGMYEVMNLDYCPEVVFIASCMVGRTIEDRDGDPLGLVTGLFLRGAKYVIAATQAVEDFYMPLLVCLFYEALSQGMQAEDALHEAKVRMKTGEWFDSTAEQISATYKPVLANTLALIDENPRQVVSSIRGWPGPVAEMTESDWTELARQDPNEMIDLTVKALYHNRESLPVDNLLMWVRGYGADV